MIKILNESKDDFLVESIEDDTPDYLKSSNRLRLTDFIDDLNYDDSEIALLEASGTLTLDLFDVGPKGIGVTITNDKGSSKYKYFPKKGDSNTVNDLWRVVKGMMKYSHGKALGWLKKHADYEKLSESIENNILREVIAEFDVIDADGFRKFLQRNNLLKESSGNKEFDDYMDLFGNFEFLRNDEEVVTNPNQIKTGDKLTVRKSKGDIPWVTVGALLSRARDVIRKK